MPVSLRVFRTNGELLELMLCFRVISMLPELTIVCCDVPLTFVLTPILSLLSRSSAVVRSGDDGFGVDGTRGCDRVC